MKVLKGSSQKKQLEHADKIFQRILKKPAFKLAATPMPVGGYIEHGVGTIFGFVAPWEGKVLGGAIFVEKYLKDDRNIPLRVEVILEIRERETSQRMISVVPSGLTLFEKELRLVRGDRIVASVTCEKPEDLYGTFFSVLFVPEIRDFQKVWDPAEVPLLEEV